MSPLLAGVLLLQMASLHAQKEPSLRGEMDTVYKGWVTAYQKKDFGAIQKMLDPEFVWLLHDGKELSRTQAEDAIKAQLDSVETGAWRVKVGSVTGGSAVANVTIEYTFAGTLKDEDNRSYKAKISGTERHIWWRAGNGWKQRRAEVLSVRTTSGENAVSSADVEGPPPPGWLAADPPRPGDGGE